MSAPAENVLCCPVLTKAGKPCRAKPMASGFCVGHSPQSNSWRARGGRAGRAGNKAEKLLPSRLRSIVEGLERAFVAVETKNFDTRKATAMATLAVALVRVFAVGVQEEAIVALRAEIAELQRAQAELAATTLGSPPQQQGWQPS